MKRANGVYEHGVKEGWKMHGICEGAKAIAQALKAYSVDSGKMNIDFRESYWFESIAC